MDPTGANPDNDKLLLRLPGSSAITGIHLYQVSNAERWASPLLMHASSHFAVQAAFPDFLGIRPSRV